MGMGILNADDSRRSLNTSSEVRRIGETKRGQRQSQSQRKRPSGLTRLDGILLHGCFRENRGTPKWDGENNGLNPIKMDDLGVPRPVIIGLDGSSFFGNKPLGVWKKSPWSWDIPTCWWQPEIRRLQSPSWGKGSWNPLKSYTFTGFFSIIQTVVGLGIFWISEPSTVWHTIPYHTIPFHTIPSWSSSSSSSSSMKLSFPSPGQAKVKPKAKAKPSGLEAKAVSPRSGGMVFESQMWSWKGWEKQNNPQKSQSYSQLMIKVSNNTSETHGFFGSMKTIQQKVSQVFVGKTSLERKKHQQPGDWSRDLLIPQLEATFGSWKGIVFTIPKRSQRIARNWQISILQKTVLKHVWFR